MLSGVLTAPVRPAVLIAGLALLLAACGSDDRKLNVLAASSLTDVFTDLEAAYEDAHPGIDLVVSTGGSPSLAAQAEAGAPASVLVTADERSMRRVVDVGGTTAEPDPIATNRVTVAAPADPPGPTVAAVTDLADSDLLVALCAPDVPCGRAAADLLDAAGVDVAPDSLELSVRAVVTRLSLGEVDAGVVYTTDVAGSDGALVAVADVAAPDVGTVRYLAAPLEGGPDGATVVDFLLGDRAQRILAEHGFAGP